MNIEGRIVRLRAVEPADIDRMYLWENDASVWEVSGTLVPFSRHTLQRFLDEQAYDLLQTRQQRLIIEVPETTGRTDDGQEAMQDGQKEQTLLAGQAGQDMLVGKYGQHMRAGLEMQTELDMRAGARQAMRAVGALDLFELDMLHRRAGIGILIHAEADRLHGYARDAVETICRHAREVLGLHQVWCNVGAANEASLRLFAACGFRETGRKRDWLRTAEGWQDEVLLQRIL